MNVVNTSAPRNRARELNGDLFAAPRAQEPVLDHRGPNRRHRAALYSYLESARSTRTCSRPRLSTRPRSSPTQRGVSRRRSWSSTRPARTPSAAPRRRQASRNGSPRRRAWRAPSPTDTGASFQRRPPRPPPFRGGSGTSGDGCVAVMQQTCHCHDGRVAPFVLASFSRQ
jgi:hypothetical protein